VKRKSLARRKTELSNKVLPDVDLRALADQITNVLHRCIGESEHKCDSGEHGRRRSETEVSGERQEAGKIAQLNREPSRRV
jgi:hypothetical protein